MPGEGRLVFRKERSHFYRTKLNLLRWWNASSDNYEVTADAKRGNFDMSNDRYPLSDNERTDAIRRHLGVALDGFIASLLATIRPMPPALQPVAVMNRRKRQRLVEK